MTNDITTAYAAATIGTNPVDKCNFKHTNITVAELRNGINPITGYYDNWKAEMFFFDKTIPLETKLEVLFGKFIAKAIAACGKDKLEAVVNKFMPYMKEQK